MTTPLAVVLVLALAGQEGPRYRYEVTLPVPPGTILYAHWSAQRDVSVAADVAAFGDLMRTFSAKDGAGLIELEDAGRVFGVPIGTPLRVLRYVEQTAPKEPAYEVRVVEGKHRDRKGWISVVFAKKRTAEGDTSKEQPKAKARPKRRR
jgi:hypothetical protein